jgi:hypothetical protein
MAAKAVRILMRLLTLLIRTDGNSDPSSSNPTEHVIAIGSVMLPTALLESIFSIDPKDAGPG